MTTVYCYLCAKFVDSADAVEVWQRSNGLLPLDAAAFDFDDEYGWACNDCATEEKIPNLTKKVRAAVETVRLSQKKTLQAANKLMKE